MKKARQQLSPRAQIAIAAALPLLLIVAGWLLLVGPQRSKASDVAAEREAAETQLVQLQAQAAHAPKPEPIRVADIFRLIKAMPDREDMPGIILQLNDVAAESGITFNSIIPQGVQAAGSGYQLRRVQLSFSGNFYGLSDFLYRLRSLVGVRGGELQADGRLFSVESLTFAEGKPSFPQIDATLTLDAYVYGTGSTPAAPVPPVTTTTTTTPADDGSTPTAAGAGTGVSD